MGQEQVVWLGGTQLRDVLHVPHATVLSLECSTSGRLVIEFSGHDSGLDQFYAIISQIRKRS
jgi:hypothetical protein